MTTRITRRITFIASAELDVRARTAQPSPSLPLTVCIYAPLIFLDVPLTQSSDAKQARDLVGVLSESKQQIDPRLAEMARYSGGGGGNRSYGGGRGGGRGGRGSGFTGSNSAALGRSRW